MQNSDTTKNMGGAQAPRARASKVRAGTIAFFAASIVIGVLVTVYQMYAIGLLVGLAVLGAIWLGLAYLRRSGLELWQIVLLMAMSGYLVLNYGFENLAFNVGGLPIILSYLLMFGALGLAAYY